MAAFVWPDGDGRWINIRKAYEACERADNMAKFFHPDLHRGVRSETLSFFNIMASIRNEAVATGPTDEMVNAARQLAEDAISAENRMRAKNEMPLVGSLVWFNG